MYTCCIPSHYKLWFLTKNGAEFCELSDADLEQYGKYLKSCQRCSSEKTVKLTEIWPKAEVITLWHCSDKREFTTEVEALRHELNIFRKG